MNELIMEEDKANKNEIKDILDKIQDCKNVDQLKSLFANFTRKLTREEIKMCLENFKLVTDNEILPEDDDEKNYGGWESMALIGFEKGQINNYKECLDYICNKLYSGSDYEYILYPVLDNLFSNIEIDVIGMIKYVISKYKLDLKKCHPERLFLNLFQNRNSEILYNVWINNCSATLLRKKNIVKQNYLIGKMLLNHIKISNHPEIVSSILDLEKDTEKYFDDEYYDGMCDEHIKIEYPIYNLVKLMNRKYLKETLPLITKINEWGDDAL